MKAFRFRLAALQRVREIRAKSARRDLQQALGERSDVEHLTAQLHAARASASEGIAAAADSETGDVVGWGRYVTSVDQAAAATGRALVEAEQRVDQARNVHREADRERRLLERLEERQRDAWRRDIERDMERTAQDAFTARWRSRRRNR